MKMNNLEYIKSEIGKLFATSPDVHININISRPKQVVDEIPATITGMYKSIFQVEEKTPEKVRRHTFQYNEVLIGQVKIKELEYEPNVTVNAQSKK